ncbi:hypothetical protein PTSG_11366 [Salpingoeca rosetta]|uniref:Uncharacterized protein n=1 Tax=Salpingoeca rosetta (strain ATCC 50818 / BSB-021) TaxID=946362 RepID=F2UT70_SALR5|nr:uncharacterized protein PTSG_11366 [Salpingoeca rosetta]EGD81329.1 hypothetical protein PTSG_11366 [Salpingoeca rosetta]|eukprot:XP_004987644.1 hypothetical protein PTSG_11366 [Salpingoeca rosetta]
MVLSLASRAMFNNLPYLLPKHVRDFHALSGVCWDRPMTRNAQHDDDDGDGDGYGGGDGEEKTGAHHNTHGCSGHTEKEEHDNDAALAAGIRVYDFNKDRFYAYSWIGVWWQIGLITRHLGAIAHEERFHRLVRLSVRARVVPPPRVVLQCAELRFANVTGVCRRLAKAMECMDALEQQRKHRPRVMIRMLRSLPESSVLQRILPVQHATFVINTPESLSQLQAALAAFASATPRDEGEAAKPGNDNRADQSNDADVTARRRPGQAPWAFEQLRLEGTITVVSGISGVRRLVVGMSSIEHIHDIQDVQELEITHGHNLRRIERIQDLSSVTISDLRHDSALRGLVGVPTVEVQAHSELEDMDMEPLRESLHVTLRSCGVHDISCLTSARVLTLNVCPRITAVGALPNLRVLDASACWELVSVDLTNLLKVSVRHPNKEFRFTPSTSSTRLKSLAVEGLTLPAGLESLPSAPHSLDLFINPELYLGRLRRADMFAARPRRARMTMTAANLGVAVGAEHVGIAWYHNTRSAELDVSALAAAQSLVLEAASCSVRGLEHLHRLQRLDVDGAYMADPSVLAALPHLTHLTYREAPAGVLDVRALSSLVHLNIHSVASLNDDADDDGEGHTGGDGDGGGRGLHWDSMLFGLGGGPGAHRERGQDEGGARTSDNDEEEREREGSDAGVHGALGVVVVVVKGLGCLKHLCRLNLWNVHIEDAPIVRDCAQVQIARVTGALTIDRASTVTITSCTTRLGVTALRDCNHVLLEACPLTCVRAINDIGTLEIRRCDGADLSGVSRVGRLLWKCHSASPLLTLGPSVDVIKVEVDGGRRGSWQAVSMSTEQRTRWLRDVVLPATAT